MTQTVGVWRWRGSGNEQRSLAAARDWHENVGVDARIFARALVKVSVQRLNSRPRKGERTSRHACRVAFNATDDTPSPLYGVFTMSTRLHAERGDGEKVW